jgi:hypothetical protein
LRFPGNSPKALILVCLSRARSFVLPGALLFGAGAAPRCDPDARRSRSVVAA